MNRLLILIPLILASPCFGATPLEDKNRPVATTAALSPAETATKMQLPKGFHAGVFAAEPNIVQPIAYTMDDRGRLWVLDCTNYPVSPGKPKDRILIIEDTDGDGTADKQSVFYDKVPFASGIAIGHGGVWVGSPPNLLFIPRSNDSQDAAAGEPEIVLDGWGADDTHETLNNFIWGPDGWLYGTQGVFTFSNVGKPGTPAAERVPMNAGIFRYHPDKKIFERYAEGGSNQWGLDWDDQGRGFFAACVISHMWQAVQGARYTRQAGRQSNPNTYDEIKTIARFAYEKRAYCGAMIYLGNTWPQEYRNTFFFNDIHMNKLRNEKFVRNGSGALSEKNGDFMTSGDPWYRGLSPQYGPDGSVFLSDWYDKVPCHQQKAYADRSNGRIYKISYEGTKPVKVDLQKASDAELVNYQLHPNDWYVRHARLILAERGGNPAVHAALAKILTENPDETRKLRALWTLHVTHGLTPALTKQSLESPLEYLRAWTIQLICEDHSPTDDQLAKMIDLAKNDSSPVVRMYLASAAGRLALDSRWLLLEALAAHEQDQDDPNIPFLIWYAAEPAVAADVKKAAKLLVLGKISKLQEFIARRMASLPLSTADDSPLLILTRTLAGNQESTIQENILRGMNAALKGKEGLVVPEGWDALYKQLKQSPNEEVRQQALSLAASFGGTAALENLRKTLADPGATAAARESALGSLLAAKDPASLPLLLDLIKTPGPLRAPSLRGLAAYDNPNIAPAIVVNFASLDANEKRDALNTLVARVNSANAILTAVDNDKMKRSDISAPLAAQLRNLRDPKIEAWVEKNWGSVRSSSAEKQKEIAQYKKFLGTDAILAADVRKGHDLFLQRCTVCHKLHGEGNVIGPELPGSFKDLDYLLQNILDPNATIGKDYQQTIVRTKDGQMLSGVITSDDELAITLKTLAGSNTIQRRNVQSVETLKQSLMPEGLLTGLQEDDIRNLFLYLRQSEPLPAKP